MYAISSSTLWENEYKEALESELINAVHPQPWHETLKIAAFFNHEFLKREGGD